MSVNFPIAENDRRIIISATAGQVALAGDFPLQDVGDLRITKISAAGVKSVLTLTTHYTVAGVGGATFTATLVTPAVLGEKYRLEGRAPIKRVTSIVTSGKFNSKSQDDEHDRHRLIQQEARRDLDQAIQAEPGIAPPVLTEALEAGRVPVIDADGLSLINGPDASEIAAAGANANAAAADAASALVSKNAAAASQAAATASETAAAGSAATALASSASATGLAALWADNVTNRNNYALWATLAGVTGSAGQGADVQGDAGTHTDPVVGGTVNNNGTYLYSVSPAGWKRIGEGLFAKADDEAVHLTIGEQLSDLRGSGSAANGATISLDANGYPIGFSGLSGSNARTTVLSGMMYPTPEEIVALTGATVRMSMVLNATAGLLAAILLASLNGQVDRSGVFSNIGTRIRAAQIGTKIYFETDYVVTSADTGFGAAFQINSSSAAIGFDFAASIVSATWRVTAWPTSISTSRDDRMRALLDARRTAINKGLFRTSLGEQWHNVIATGEALAGAAVITTDKRMMGFTIPNGSTGASSYIVPEWRPVSWVLAALVGATIRVAAVYTVTANFRKNKAPSATMFKVRRTLLTNAGTVVGTVKRDEQIGTKLYRDVEYVVTSDDLAFISQLQIPAGATNAGVDHSVELVSLDWYVVAWPTYSVESDGDRQRRVRDSQPVTDKVRTAGATGDYTDPEVATNAITDAGPLRPYRINVQAATYDIGDWFTKDHVHICGAGIDRTILRKLMPANTVLATISTTEGVLHEGTGLLSGLTVIVENARYAIHDDSNGRKPDRHTVIRDVKAIHLGNAGARAYQVSIGQPANAVWANAYAHGMGVMSGCVKEFINCHFEGEHGGASYHTQLAFARPSLVRYIDGFAGGTMADAIAIGVQALGSGQQDACEISGMSLRGDIQYYPYPWYPTTLAYQPSDRSEISVYGHGNAPAVFRVKDSGERALKIESAAVVGTSSVVVSGTGALALFGTPVQKDGAGGIKGYSYGSIDIANHAVGVNSDTTITKMGQRLGDCSSVNKTLTVVVDGGAPINIVFSTNLTAVANATILATINAALGSAAVASEYWITGRYRARFCDEERSLLNNTAVGIPMGSVLAWDGSQHNVRLMTSADAASLFAGVAIDDIYPAKLGRVKTGGWLSLLTDVLRTDSAGSDAFGSTFSIDAAAPGKVYRGGSQGLLKIVRLATGIAPTAVAIGSI